MIRPVEEKDFDEINRWRSLRGAHFLNRDWYPLRGAIIDGVAAGFCFMTDTKLVLLEHFVSNPEADHREAVRGLEDIANYLTDKAKEEGFRYAVVYLYGHTLKNACLRNGWKLLPPSVALGKEI